MEKHIREITGSFYSPQIWVELSQKYLTDVLGENWQDEYYIWDCAAGTGNLLTGLTNKYNIWASTLDKQDVEVMKDRIKNGANLLEDHIFQFDFLNDDFEKLPKPLFEIIKNPKKRKKLVIYINPPYADASSNIKAGSKQGNSFSAIQEKYKSKLGSFSRELFAQFLIRIYYEIPDCIIAEFSKVKLLNATHAKLMRSYFLASLIKMFVVPADTFDNVTGKFPIAFKIWDTSIKEKFTVAKSDVFNAFGVREGFKKFYSYDNNLKINKWLKEVKEDINGLGYLSMGRNDFQNNNLIFIKNLKEHATNYSYPINWYNLIKISIYFAVQKVVESTWLNDRDQFLVPNNKWQKDNIFQNDCFTYTLFNTNIQSKFGTNYWIPYREFEVNSREKFESNFMSDFINGKINKNTNLNEDLNIFHSSNESQVSDEFKNRTNPLEFSAEAKAVFDSGRELWKYYHSQPFSQLQVAYKVNASLYDIREHFQGRNEKGKMNNKSSDDIYNSLISDLREKLKILAQKIEPKVYEYGFLKG